MSDPTVTAFLTKLLCSHGGRLSRDQLSGFLQLSTEEIEQILRDEPQKFPVVGDLVLARNPVRICPKYLKNDPEEECDKLHLCRYYLQGKCWPGKRPQCNLSHEILSNYNRSVLKANEISGLNIDEVKVLLFQNDNQLLPEVCVKYLHDVCNLGMTCKRLHVCSKFTQGECGRLTCDFSHNLLENRAVIFPPCCRMCEISVENFQMLCTVKNNEHLQSLREKVQNIYESGNLTALSDRGRPRKRKISLEHLLNKLQRMDKEITASPSSLPSTSYIFWNENLEDLKPAPLGHQTDKTSEYGATDLSPKRPESAKVPEICLSNLWKYGKLGGSCPDMHYYLPYRWQIYKGTDWEDIFNMEEIEKSYCDPKVDRVPLIDFLTMTSGVYRVRRLSNVSSVVKPPEYVLTNEWLCRWKDEYGTTTQYGHPNVKQVSSTILSSDLENVYLSDPNASVPFTIGSHDYGINFQEMKQKNIHYKTEKVVRRRPRFLSFEDVKLLRGSTKSSAAKSPLSSSPLKADIYPQTWDAKAMPEIGCGKVLVSDTSSEFSEIVSNFMKTVSGHVVKKMWRLQNPSLWQVFQWQKEQMKKVYWGQDVRDMRLFHGTKKVKIDAICNQNFDWRICGTHGTTYGQGSYFARDASYSHKYSTPTPNGTRTMFVARVLVGDYVAGNSKMRRPPLRPGSSARCYDSCVDNTMNPAIFVVFEKHQIYPEYLLEYKE